MAATGGGLVGIGAGATEDVGDATGAGAGCSEGVSGASTGGGPDSGSSGFDGFDGVEAIPIPIIIADFDIPDFDAVTLDIPAMDMGSFLSSVGACTFRTRRSWPRSFSICCAFII
jgi:hypothetical protein